MKVEKIVLCLNEDTSLLLHGTASFVYNNGLQNSLYKNTPLMPLFLNEVINCKPLCFMVIIISILYACMQVFIFLITLSTKIEDRKLRGLRKHWAWTSKQCIIGLL